MFHGFRLRVALALLTAGLSCSETATRPDPIGDCDDPACPQLPSVPPTSIGSGSGAEGNSGSGGEGGGGGLPPPQVGTLAGSVRTIIEPDLLSDSGLDGSVEIRAAGATQNEISTESELDGTYRLDGVLPSTELWVAVGAFQTPPAPPFMDTLQVVDATMAGFVDLLVMRQSVMDDIAQVSFMNDPLELDPLRGHVILSFIDQNGAPVSGVQVVEPGIDEAAIAYDAGDVYSDQLEETASRGTVVLVNMSAPAYPGGLISVSVTLDGVSYSTPIRTAAGAVTVVSAQIGLQP